MFATHAPKFRSSFRLLQFFCNSKGPLDLGYGQVEETM